MMAELTKNETHLFEYLLSLNIINEMTTICGIDIRP